MSQTATDRSEMLASTLAEMEASEPAFVTAADPFDCDVLDGDADHTLGMWTITYRTFMTDPNIPDSERDDR